MRFFIKSAVANWPFSLAFPLTFSVVTLLVSERAFCKLAESSPFVKLVFYKMFSYLSFPREARMAEFMLVKSTLFSSSYCRI